MPTKRKVSTKNEKSVDKNKDVEMISKNVIITMEKDIWTLIEQMHLDFKARKNSEISLDEYLSRKVSKPFYVAQERMRMEA